MRVLVMSEDGILFCSSIDQSFHFVKRWNAWPHPGNWSACWWCHHSDWHVDINQRRHHQFKIDNLLASRDDTEIMCVYWSWSSLWSLSIKDDLKSPSSFMLCLSPLTPRRSGKASPSTLPSILEIIVMTRGLNPTWGGDRGRPRKLGFDDSLLLSWKALAVRWWWWCWSPL